MVGCCVLGCKSRSELNIKEITFHQFPSDNKTYNLWLEATGRTNWQPTKHSKICSIHFRKDDFEYKGQRVILNQFSIPTENIWVNKDRISTESQAFNHSRASHDIKERKSPTTEDLINRMLVAIQKLQSKSHITSTTTTSESGHVTEQQRPKNRRELVLKKLIMRERVKSARRLKIIHLLRESKQRMNKKVAMLKDSIMDVKFKMKPIEEELNLLSGIKTDI